MGVSIDIIVPTYNRPKDIGKFIEEIQKQNIENFKVFIIDDHGDEDISHLIPKNSSKFHYYRLEKNSGQAYARNYALKIGKSPIVIFMDDDAWFLQKDALERIIHYFSTKIDLGCLMFNILEPNRDWLSNRNNIEDGAELAEFIACGVAFKRDAIELIGGFSSFLHSYGEETEISMRLIDANYKLYFGKKIEVFHNYIPDTRNRIWKNRFIHNTVRNDLLIIFIRYPIIFILPYLVFKPLSHVKYYLTKKQFNVNNLIQILKGVFSFILLIPYACKHRQSVSIQSFNYWRKNRF